MPLLDVLRGVAILGTLMTNVWIFTGPGAEWGVLSGGTSAGGVTGSAGDVAEAVFRLVADGKFLSMLTILFGAGLAIQYRSAERRGEPWPGRYRWRALFLFAEGTVHFVLVFAWDVLMGYAVTALFTAWLLTRSARARRRVAVAAAGLHLTLMGLLTAVLVAYGDGDAGAGDGVSPQVVDLYAHGSWADQIAFRLENAVALRLEPVLTFGLLLFLFLLGVRLLRAGAFAADGTGRRIRARMLRWGLGLGVPLNAACAVGGEDWFLLGRYGAAPLVAVGYVGLIGAVVDRVRRPGPLTRGLTSLGRTALTGYVLQNLLCVLVSYGFGLGLAARLGEGGRGWEPWWVMGLWASVSVLLLVASTLWLRRFPAGPLEAVQRWALGLAGNRSTRAGRSS
ncbi:DUF418 domain-containing protein [Streptomyces roseolilacinus]|uniref:DUF418 domain-containing protein n=1 Tax=Streptomyces roseolilacinus TaxID=66904 RepID=A0A918ELB6_9ACTN|nr:DUF418 domain-containing protein [Streptomyces roseolilacinus]GGQ12956.1 hypothetical protein GCM10010249_34600 [Streptomyces roseolilacinus]